MPKISVVIPIYNVDKYLKECLDSVVNQTLKDIEIICVNDGSTDGSLKILEEYAQKDNRIIVINQENQGQGVARNKGIDVASGEYIAFVDPDDFIDLNTFEIVYNKFKETNVDIVQFDYQTCTEYGKFIENHPLYKQIYKKINLKLKNNQVFCWQDIKNKDLSAMRFCATDKVYSSMLIKDNKIRFASNRIGEDHLFAIGTSLIADHILYLNRYFYHYRQREDSSVHKCSNDNFGVFDNILLLKKFLAEHELYNVFSKSFNNYVLEAYVRQFVNIPLENKEVYLNKCKEILSVEDYKKFLKEIKPRYTFLQRIFSIKNHRVNGQKQKIICILGIEIIFKYKNKKLISKENNAQGNVEKERIIISLTSYPKRINVVNKAIESLLNQTFKADKIILWLAEEQFPNKENDLPQQLLNLKAKGLEIDWCKDIKSYKKLIPALKKYPNDAIVTADDDILYEKGWLETLVSAYRKKPDLLNVHRSHYINYINSSYNICYDSYSNIKPCYNLFCTTGSGIIYPPHLFSNEVFNEEAFMKLAPTSDDLWFWAMTILQGVKINVVKNNIDKIECIENTQADSLWEINKRGGDSKALNNVIAAYPKIKERLDKKILFHYEYNSTRD